MSNEDVVSGGKGMLDRLAKAHLSSTKCYRCDYETLKLLLEPRTGVSYMTARLSLSTICAHCATLPKRAIAYAGTVVPGLVPCEIEVDVYIPQVVHARFLDGSWLKDSRDRYAVIATMSQTLRDIYNIEEETGVYGHDLRFLITALHTWLPSLYKAEATPLLCFGCFPTATTRWRPYRKNCPLMFAIEYEEKKRERKRLEAELKKHASRKDDEDYGDGDSEGETSVKDDQRTSQEQKSNAQATKDGRVTRREQERDRRVQRAEEMYEKLQRPIDPKGDKEKAEEAIKRLQAQLKQELDRRAAAEKHVAAMKKENADREKAREKYESERLTNHAAVEVYNEAMAASDSVPTLKGQSVPFQPVDHKQVTINEHRPGDDKRTLERWHEQHVQFPEREAALISTVTKEVTFFEDNPANAYEALRRRMLSQGSRDFTAPKHVRNRLRNTTNAYINAFLKPEKVAEAFKNMGGVGGCKPNSWSEERWWAALNKLIEGEIPRNFKLTIKPEAGKPGKAPRPISNEGDLWQAMNSVVFKVIEALDATQLVLHNIKHKDLDDRHAAIKAVGESMRGIVCEGDGSAWDACCGPEIQKYIELPVFKHVADIVYDMILEFSTGSKAAAKRRREAKSMTYEMYTKANVDKATGRQKIGIGLSFVVRSSGDSGTSYLNRLVNMICWVVGIAKHPEKLIRKMGDATPSYECLFEQSKGGKPVVKRVGCFFEGDDSLLFLDARTRQYQDKIEEYWSSIGFNMKLKFIDDSTKTEPAEFCGYHYWVENGKLTGASMPDGRRSLANCQMTVSKQALKGPAERDSIAASSAIGRQCQHSHGFAPLADVYEAKGEAYGGWKAACGARMTLREEKDLSYKISGKYDQDTALTSEVLDEAYLAQRMYYAQPEAYIPLAQKSLGMTSGQLSILTGAGPLTHSDHPDAAVAFCQA